MNLSANLTMLYHEHGFLDRFDAAAADGFGGVEFVSPYDFTPDQVAAAARRAGVSVVLFNTPAGDWAAGERGCACHPDARDRFRDSIEKALVYAQALACPRLHIMAGNLPPGIQPDAGEAVLIDNLQWTAERLARAQVKALIEPINRLDMPSYGLSSLPQAERVLTAVGHANLRLQYDFYHMAMMGEALVPNFQRLLPQIGHVQFADAPGRHEPGTGSVDFAPIFEAIRASGYDGWVGAEYRPAAATGDSLAWLAEAHGGPVSGI